MAVRSTLWTLLLASAFVAVPTAAHADARPRIIDRELFFGDPEISGAQLSPDGRHIAFIKPVDGTRNLWVKETRAPFSKARPITDQTDRPIPAYFWTRDGRYILYVKDQGGDENYNIYQVDPRAKPPEGARVPPSKNLTDLEGVRARIYSVPKSKPDVIFVGLNDRDKAWHDLYQLRLSTGELTKLRENSDRVAGWVFDLEGELRLGVRTTADTGAFEILRVEGDALTPVYTCTVFETCNPIRFHPDGKRVYLSTNAGKPDLTRLVLFDPESKEETVVASDPKDRVDLTRAVFSEKTDALVATVYTDARTRVRSHDPAYEKDYRLLERKLKGYEVEPTSATADERLWLVSATSDVEPGKTYLFDRRTKKLTEQYTIREDLPRRALAPMKSIDYRSSDGLRIPAYLTLPRGVKPQKLPLVVFPHGGPWARDYWGYDPYAQFLANRGFAVLQPNFRGSTGYGKKFLNAGNGEWGQLMQDDLTWGVKHLVKKGLADPKRIAIMGGSYGGYATLAGVAFTPELYAAGVSIVGPSNLITLLDSIPPYWAPIRRMFYERMGDPTTDAGRAQLERQSPLNSAEKIRTPLMVIQGANDPRVKKAESDQIVVALREQKFPVEYLVAPDEGHGFQKPENRMAMIAAVERFFHAHVGTRFQQSATPEVAQRLEALTVDVATVTVSKAVDASAVEAPEPALGLEPGTTRFASQMAVNGQTLRMETEQTIAADGDRWVITQKTTSPNGEMSDRAVLAKGSHVLLERRVEQGRVTIDFTVSGGRVDGSMTAMGNTQPIAVELDGPLFADGAGSGAVIATLPLAPGYTARFRQFDVQRQKTDLKQLEVEGVESLTIPAGTFDAFRVKITSAEGEPGTTTIWVDEATRRFLKVEAVVPQMNGAVITTERLPDRAS